MEEPSDEQFGIDFDIAKSLRYHAYRRSFWDFWNNFSKISIVISGTAVLVTLIGNHKLYATVTAFIVAFTSAGDLVLGFSHKARIHDGLYRAFSMLAQETATVENPDAATFSRWRRRRLEIEMDEPFIIDWLERRCSGEEAKARGCYLRPAWKLNWFQVAFSQLAFWPASLKNADPQPTSF